MPQSLANILVQIIFSTKNRVPFIAPGLDGELFPYLATTFGQCQCPAIEVGGADDHVHVLCRLGRTVAVSKLVEQVKTSSSKWIKTKGPDLARFARQNGYGAFSIGQSQAAAARRYIASQREHHRRRTFQEEFRVFLKRYGMEYDERYVWD